MTRTYGYATTQTSRHALRRHGAHTSLPRPAGDAGILEALDASPATTGDRVLVTALADIAATTRDAVRVIAAIHRRGMTLSILDPPLDTAQPAVAAMLDALYRLEPRKNAGRPTVVTPDKLEHALTLRRNGLSIHDTAQHIGVSPSALQRALSATRDQAHEPDRPSLHA